MVFCNFKQEIVKKEDKNVTILILIDGFLQCVKKCLNVDTEKRHNPYFNRWFSAI